MTNYSKILFWCSIQLLLIYNFYSFDYLSNNKKIRHSIEVKHPGEKGIVNATLTEVQNKEGLPIQYYMDVESVICLEEVCKVIPVTLYWNNIGHYQKYQLQKGATLEKYKSDLFEPEDYKKLHTVLNNFNSPFKDVFIDEILTVPDNFNEGVDALSGETILELDENETVHGAALTCYTLWHWANGEMVSIIKTKTGKSASKQQLQDYILNEDNTYFRIAVRELQNRKQFSKDVVDTIIKKVLQDNSLLRLTFKYLKQASPDVYFYATKRFFYEGKKAQKLAAIQSLREISYKVPNSYLDMFSSKISTYKSYQEVSLLLGLMNQKNPNSKKVIENTLPLLNGDFLIARRAYWFLKKQELNEAQSIRLRIFYEKHKDKL